MKKVAMIIAVGITACLLFTGCKKKEEQPVPKTPAQEQPIQAPIQQPMQSQGQAPMQAPPTPHGPMGPKVEKTVVIPDSVKGKWSKVVLVLEDRKSNKKSDHTVKIGSEYAIPNTGLKVTVTEFLPEFRMDGTTITSASNDPKNPAVKIEITEKGKQVYKGWLFSKMPEVHPFQHERYGIILKEGIKG